MIQNLIFGILFLKILFRHTAFLYSSTCYSGHHHFLLIFRFSRRKSQSQQKLEKNGTQFTIQFRSKNHSFLQISTHLTLKMIWSGKQHSQKPFWLYTISSKHVSVSCQKKHFLTAKNYIHEALGKKMSVYLCTSL